MLLSGAASAAWERAGRTDTFAAYADRASIRLQGNTARMWQMYDYGAPQTYPDNRRYLSTRSHYEYDCREMKARLLAIRAYPGNMAKGKPIASESPAPEWRAVGTESILATLREFACRGRKGR